MRKALMALALGALVSMAGQPQQTVSPEEKALKEAMRSMADGMTRIQKAILYNDKEQLLAGVRTLKRIQPGFLTKHGEALKKFMPDNSKFAMSLAKKSEIHIQRYVDMMREDIFSRQDYSNIAAGYTHILSECVGCHQKLRKWRWGP
jgi:cytochrome c556